MKDDFEMEEVLDRLLDEFDKRISKIDMNISTKGSSICDVVEMLYIETKAKHHDCSREVMALIIVGKVDEAFCEYIDQKKCSWTDAGKFIKEMKDQSTTNLKQYLIG